MIEESRSIDTIIFRSFILGVCTLNFHKSTIIRLCKNRRCQFNDVNQSSLVIDFCKTSSSPSSTLSSDADDMQMIRENRIGQHVPTFLCISLQNHSQKRNY